MPKFEIGFIGRERRAIGIFYPIQAVIEVQEEFAPFFRGLSQQYPYPTKLPNPQATALLATPELGQLYEQGWDHVQFKGQGTIREVPQDTPLTIAPTLHIKKPLLPPLAT